MRKTIEITLKDGDVRIEAKGYKGRGCLDATKPFENALGVVKKRRPKPELHSMEEAGANVTNRQRTRF